MKVTSVDSDWTRIDWILRAAIHFALHKAGFFRTSGEAIQYYEEASDSVPSKHDEEGTAGIENGMRKGLTMIFQVVRVEICELKKATGWHPLELAELISLGQNAISFINISDS